MSHTAMKNLHVPLPERLHLRLREAAELAQRPATELAREAIADWLTRWERRKVYSQVAEYAAHYGGTTSDLDRDLEAAGLDHLSSSGPGEPEKA